MLRNYEGVKCNLNSVTFMYYATVSCILVSDENTSSTPMREGGLHYLLSHYLMTSYPVF